MGAGASSRKILKPLLDKLKISVGISERSISIIYARFVFLFISTIKDQK